MYIAKTKERKNVEKSNLVSWKKCGLTKQLKYSCCHIIGYVFWLRVIGKWRESNCKWKRLSIWIFVYDFSYSLSTGNKKEKKTKIVSMDPTDG